MGWNHQLLGAVGHNLNYITAISGGQNWEPRGRSEVIDEGCGVETEAGQQVTPLDAVDAVGIFVEAS